MTADFNLPVWEAQMAIHMAEKKWNSGEMNHNIRFSGLQGAKRNRVLPVFSPKQFLCCKYFCLVVSAALGA